MRPHWQSVTILFKATELASNLTSEFLERSFSYAVLVRGPEMDIMRANLKFIGITCVSSN